MLLDWEAGRPMELEVILGNPVKIARAKGFEMPRLQSMYALLKVSSRSDYLAVVVSKDIVCNSWRKSNEIQNLPRPNYEATYEMHTCPISRTPTLVVVIHRDGSL